MGKKKYDREHIAELKKNAEFMREKLKESREAMQSMPIVMPYDNGGGQTGIRENPAFPAYEKLMKSYIATITLLRDVAEYDNQGYQLRSKWVADTEGSEESSPLLRFESKFRNKYKDNFS